MGVFINLALSPRRMIPRPLRFAGDLADPSLGKKRVGDARQYQGPQSYTQTLPLPVPATSRRNIDR